MDVILHGLSEYFGLCSNNIGFFLESLGNPNILSQIYLIVISITR
jgi:hypothetical protein